MRKRLSVTWLLPLVVLVPMGLAHCSGADDSKNPIGGQKGGNDSGGKVSTGDDGPTSSGADDSGQPPSIDATAPSVGDSSTPPSVADASTGLPAPGSDGGAAPEGGPASGSAGSVTCNGAPCPVDHGYTCCAATTDAGSVETCKPPNSTCAGRTLACDEAADCNGGVCCVDLLGGTACQTTCYGIQICRTDGECGTEGTHGAPRRCVPQTCTDPYRMRSIHFQACSVSGFGDAGTLGPICKPDP
jgi:hypothetical protein